MINSTFWSAFLFSATRSQRVRERKLSEEILRDLLVGDFLEQDGERLQSTCL